jgi:hypothetical protein
MAISVTTISPRRCIGPKLAQAILRVTFDDDYPTGGESIDLSAYGFNYVKGVKQMSYDSGVIVQADLGVFDSDELGYPAESVKLLALIQDYSASVDGYMIDAPAHLNLSSITVLLEVLGD